MEETLGLTFCTLEEMWAHLNTHLRLITLKFTNYEIPFKNPICSEKNISL